MEYCAAQAPTTPEDLFRQRFSVHRHGPFLIAALHSVYVGHPCSREAEDVLEFRANNLAQYIVKFPSFPEDMETALSSAFDEMDKEVKSRFPDVKLCPWFLSTKSNTIVAIVHNLKKVYIAGVADATVGLARGSKLFRLIPTGFRVKHAIKGKYAMVSGDKKLDAKWEQLIDHPSLFYFREEDLLIQDSLLIIASDNIFDYIATGFLEVLQTRIKAVGLDKACAAVVGRYLDVSKILIVVTLKSDAHVSKVVRTQHSDVHTKKQEYEIPLSLVPDLEAIMTEPRYHRDPRRCLLPLGHGQKEQIPEPITTRDYACTGYHNYPVGDVILKSSCEV